MAESSRSGGGGALELPPEIIHHILSYLSAEESTRASLLSKSWLGAWQTRPKLEFNPKLYFHKKLKLRSPWLRSKKETTNICEEFFWHVKKTLKPYRKQGICIDTLNFRVEGVFSLLNPFVKECTKVAARNGLEECTKVAVQNGVRNLDFSLPDCDLPEIVFGAKSLVELSVRDGYIMPMSVGKIMCSELRKLCLIKVDLDVEMFDNITESCPLIEVLEVRYIEGFDNFKVTKLNNLKELAVGLLENQSVIVDAPELESLTCIDEENGNEDEDEYEQSTCLITLTASWYQNLKCLLFTGIGIGDSFFMEFAYKFPNLEDLIVRYCRELESIKISSQSLKRIQLMDNNRLVEAQFDVPKIVSFEYCSGRSIVPRFHFAAASSGWTSYFCLSKRVDVNSSWFVELRELLASVIQSKISLEIDFGCSISFDLDEIRNIVKIHEPQEVDELALQFDWMFSLEKGLSALDGLFWVCRPKYVYAHWDDDVRENEAMKFLYETLMFRKIQDRFHDSQLSKIWLHDLKEVNVEVFDMGTYVIVDRIVFTKRGMKEQQQQEDLDWENFLSLLRNNGIRERIVCFKLEFRTHDIPQEVKRLKMQNLKLDQQQKL